MIVNNSSNINKQKESLSNDCQQFLQSTNKKESLNNDCQQFLQYQQTKKKV